jgi:Rod binding domain-containing protein
MARRPPDQAGRNDPHWFRNLAALESASAAQRPRRAPSSEAAKQFEALFMQELMKSHAQPPR